ncbi:bifunctional UDP-N-acetylmuramoyl-tripeptide:D-alanyl-D-alanine ligase/alanine racemase [Labilibacter marinus]|uniref:bifunctional UDP-N-acetylmuramoyl-tripeptide:D-alanyl-D-alanine ligase/alanine racemase n=1 Tax=Labilibacter marinus TaxID=1477105 RepID=UPI000835FB84|nr:bifunctional UDP-N-acetylmuramoyl-tripeptide:D-alanyl-D-alanine ligase/alanine racemase [Labilibacter marinus]
MQAYKFSDIGQWLNGKLIVGRDTTFTNIITDSRSVSNPKDSLFIAISGKNHNGHQYITSLYQQGVRCFFVEPDFTISDHLNDANFFVVENTLLAFQQLVAYKRSLFACPVVGVTGSNGKTIVKEWISQLVGKSKIMVRSPKSYNSQIGVPLSVWHLNATTELAVFEAGISQKGEMEKIASIISPTIGVITNIGAAHQENFSSQQEKLQEKLKLFKDSDAIVYCADSKLIKEGVERCYPNKKMFSWGTSSDCTLNILAKETSGSIIHVEIKYKDEVFVLELPFSDEASFENAMNSITVLLYLGYDFGYISTAIKKLVPVAMRMELKEGVNNCLVINDSYNSDLSSLSLSLDFLVQQSKNKTQSRTLILSDIYQSGIPDLELCQQINTLLKDKNISRLIGVGEGLRTHCNQFDMDAVFYDSTNELLQSLTTHMFKNEAILIKGSRNFEFELVSEVLEMKHHQTCLEINMNALVDNLNFYRSKLKSTTKVLAMVKAFSYGSGSYEIASILQHQKVDYLGVAFADEGVELRKAGISLPIIVMNPEEKSFPLMIEHHLEPEIYSFKVLGQFIELFKKEGISDYPVHIKYDSGMNRLGFVSDDQQKLFEVLKEQQELRVKSCFSHLVGSDEKQFDAFTHQQVDAFKVFTAELERHLNYSFIKHILNSAGILRFPEAQFDMVRLGIGMYGIGAVEQQKLKSVTRFKSFISQIKYVKAHETIGYSRQGELSYDAEIAIVPVGYADGLNRRLGNGVGKMIVGGQLAVTVGNICMDMCMIDVTGLKANEGDEVEIFGPDNSVDDLAQSIDTISYEVFTSISRRVKRVYYYE